jgi:outer membrane protein assembly factor BamB
MLHAFFVSRWNAQGGGYLIDDPDGGAELWSYLPGSFLAHLESQPVDNGSAGLAVHLDGSPEVRELLLDLDGDGVRHWHTLLAATGTILLDRKSCLLILDISDPNRPHLLWETLLPGQTVGRTRGVAIDGCPATEDMHGCLYLTADHAGGDDAPGIHALALDLVTGKLLWQFSASYAASGPVAGATPAVPGLMDVDGDHRNDTLVFGDLVGRLWALDLENGRPYGEGPVYQVPGGAAEPIGAGVAVQGQVAVLGTGGVEGSDDSRQYAVYAIEITPAGSRLLWVYNLAPGEKVWAKPVIDVSGNLLLGTAHNYLARALGEEPETSGRMVALDNSGREVLARQLSAAVVAGPVSGPGVTVLVTLTGEASRLGNALRQEVPASPPVSVRILSWRER